MMGCHTCGGTVTGPVGTAPERAKESMFTPCVVVPTVEIWRIGPVFPEKKTLYPRVISIPVVSPSSENIALPVAFLTASCSQLPASRSPPCVQARKRAVLSEILNRITEIHHDREIDRCRHDGHRVTVDRIAPGEIEQDSPVHSYPICCNVLESVSCGLKITSNHGRSNI